MAPAVGIDLIEIERVERALERRPRLAQRLFTDAELAYSRDRSRPGRHLAARFAAKEAVIKALGIDGFEPLDVEVLGGGERCSVLLHGAAEVRARELGVVVTISLTHVAAVAAAVAMARAVDRH